MIKLNINELENLAISPDIPVLGEVARLKQIGDQLFVTLLFYSETIAEHIDMLLRARLPGMQVDVTCQTEAKTVQPNVPVRKDINNIIAISSGKGGVGKSSTAVNLALALAETGAKVGLLDADIYGPSQPTMLGIHDYPELIDEKTMRPNFVHGIESHSIGYLVDGDEAMIWRAPMIVNALRQLLDNTAWGTCFTDDKTKTATGSKRFLDYLIIDLPPGTGDISLSVAQKIPVTGVITVTTPQDIALIDGRRSIKLFNKMHIDHIGIIENMSTHICQRCGHESPLFGTRGGSTLADEFGVALLGRIPLDIMLRESLDAGKPIVVAEPDHPISRRYRQIAEITAVTLAKKPKSFSRAFGTIVVEK
ncbi:MAG: hypothetical protein CSA47_02085 [Gammaproteobacteria bacterium]|nr:MAG: hypothetical protein CSA47_02085 [Gammaproteobacteria bacterium]